MNFDHVFQGNVPESMPAHFVSTFTPIDEAGTTFHIKQVSRLLAAQISTQGPDMDKVSL